MVAALAVGGMAGGTAAFAADGPAPAPAEFRVLDTEHTDTVATFWDDGEFSLGSKADVDGNLGVRFPADGILVHINDLARLDNWPAGYEFVAPAGSTVWLAPMTRQNGVVWPGFSTESVPVGVLDGNITFTLDGVTGPGDVELWTTSAFGGVQERLWSSDEAVKSFARPINTHMHANWAFTQPGTYELTVTASAVAVGGTSVSDTATYTFVAGPLAEQVATSTVLHVDGESTVPEGAPVQVHATVTPATVEGFVEFRNGATVLGHIHIEADGGEAGFEVTGLGVGSHSITAHFVPKVRNFTAGSVSDAVTVTVTDASGVEFGISGVQESYQPGDTLEAQIVGATLSAGQSFDWTIRPIGTGWDPFPSGIDTGSTYSRMLTASEDGYEISAAIVENWAVVSRTAWVPIHVAQLAAPPAVSLIGESRVHTGSTATLSWGPDGLAEGDTIEWVYRFAGDVWRVAGSGYPYPLTDQPDEQTATVRSELGVGPAEFGLRIVRDGVAVAQSNAVTVEFVDREVHFDGLQPVYREGATLRVEPRLYPEIEDLTYQWRRWDPIDRQWQDQPESAVPTLERSLTMADDGSYWQLSAKKDGIAHIGGGALFQVRVSDAPADQTLLVLQSMAAHYHQGDQIALNLSIEPAPADDDVLTWQWRWPGADWAELPGVSGTTGSLTAEQALDGVEIRAVLTLADPEAEPLTAVATIFVDDHGAAPRQQPTIAGETSVTDGDTVTLTRELPANGPTVLTEHRWEMRTGDGAWTVVEGETGSELSFTAAASDDGAQYRVSIIKPTGQVAYGPSPAVTLAVSGSEAAFSDVPVGSPFFDEVTWAAAAGITTGYDDGTFRPVASISRDAVAAMLFRASNVGADKPVCAPGEQPFTDVPSTYPFCGEIAWAKAEGITTGNPDGTFWPARAINRDAMAAFMARAYGPDTLPACAGERPFPDVAVNHPFCKEIQWLKAAGITTGFADGTFKPALAIERQAFVAFVHRAEH